MYTNDTGGFCEELNARGLARWIQSRSCIKLNINNSGLWIAGQPAHRAWLRFLFATTRPYTHLSPSSPRQHREDHNTPTILPFYRFVPSFVARSSSYTHTHIYVCMYICMDLLYILDIYAPYSPPLNKQDLSGSRITSSRVRPQINLNEYYDTHIPSLTLRHQPNRIIRRCLLVSLLLLYMYYFSVPPLRHFISDQTNYELQASWIVIQMSVADFHCSTLRRCGKHIFSD